MRLVVFGAGGHSKEAADLIHSLDHTIVAFVDESRKGVHETTGAPIVDHLDKVNARYDGCAFAVGDGSVRRRFFESLPDGVLAPSLVHPTASVSPHAHIGAGSMLMNNVVVSAHARLGECVIANVGTFVAHDGEAGPYTHLAPGSQLGGGSKVGSLCLVGTGAIILPGCSIGSEVMVGAGCVVTADFPDGVTLVGIPARAKGGASG